MKMTTKTYLNAEIESKPYVAEGGEGDDARGVFVRRSDEVVEGLAGVQGGDSVWEHGTAIFGKNRHALIIFENCTTKLRKFQTKLQT